MDDDYDDNVIYEGDSDELNEEFLIDEDFEKAENTTDDENNDDEILKCRSAPISPTRDLLRKNKKNNFETSFQQENGNHQKNCTSFIYDMNLYNDQQNLLILNNQDEFKKIFDA